MCVLCSDNGRRQTITLGYKNITIHSSWSQSFCGMRHRQTRIHTAIQTHNFFS